ncbi:hypothetical protein [Breoghania sp.]|uniref:hypothetical protein n=1 Tax=Breoghania sp. TaxID=2065378 RepID=UPI00262B5480|nr:hypothetical protein [Breoghania sp.]MDJ0933486.1 hypothetical protein [Breoghania sp.]
MQSRLVELAGSAATFAFLLNGSMIYLGQGLGIVIGAAAFARWGLASAPASGLTMTFPASRLRCFWRSPVPASCRLRKSDHARLRP